MYRRLFGVPLEGAHDARNDVAACVRIFFALQGMSPAGDVDEEARHAGELIERVLDWAADHDWFDTSFAERKVCRRAWRNGGA